MIQLVLVLLFLGIILYLIETFVPMAAPFKVLIRIVIVVFSILIIMRAFGIVDIPIRTVR